MQSNRQLMIDGMTATLRHLSFCVSILLIVLSSATSTAPAHRQTGQWPSAPMSPRLPTIHGIIRGLAALGPRDIWAVGEVVRHGQTEPLTMHWNGMAWATAPTPTSAQGPSSLEAITALSPTDIWAVGETAIIGRDSIALAEHWDGTAWHIVDTPAGGPFRAIAATSGRDVWAVGNRDSSGHRSPLIEHWNGQRWSEALLEDPGLSGGYLSGVVALSPRNVWVVGTLINYSRGTLVEHWDGRQWSVVHSPNDPWRKDNELLGVVARAPDDIWAVGRVGIGQYRPIIEHWNGARWGLVHGGTYSLPDASLDNGFVDATNHLWVWGGDAAAYPGPPPRPFLARSMGTGWQVFPVVGSLVDDVARVGHSLWAATEPVVNNNPNIPRSVRPVIQAWMGRDWQPRLLTDLTGPADFGSKY